MAVPPHPPDRMPVGLCIFGMTYLCGMTWRDTPQANPQPLTLDDIFQLARKNGLSSVEVAVGMLPSTAPSDLRQVRSRAEALGLRFVVPGGRVTVEALSPAIEIARELGAPVVRCVISGVLCGDRRGFPGGWTAHMAATERELETLVPLAEKADVAIAIENHQDVDSHDLLQLCERFSSRHLGVTLDTGNPLAVMEHPLEFAERIAPWLRHSHVKDYAVHPAENGFRLVRCPLGEGVLDIPALFRLFDEQELPITRHMEMGALNARQIPMLEPDWWDEFPARSAQEVLPALELIWNKLRPREEEWRTPLERETSGEELAAYEWAQFHHSLKYLRETIYPGQS